MEKIAKRKQLIGTVVSNKTSKTISVAVDTYKTHKLYKKGYKSTKKFAVHDEKELANVGDKVQIIETRPLSKTKRFRLKTILEKSKEVN
ncbi:MAG: 30S ribosomal protein S17 [Mycoplasma sp.]|nr:30S ribosomal protein S17 [Mycoplasma sp.]